jgi:hypothetical protein
MRVNDSAVAAIDWCRVEEHANVLRNHIPASAIVHNSAYRSVSHASDLVETTIEDALISSALCNSMNSSIAPTYWSQLCQASKSVELNVLMDRARGVSASAIFFFLATAILSLVSLQRWFRLEAGLRTKVWGLYGRFSSFIAAGSCMGVVSWAANMLFLEYDFRSTQDKALSPFQRHIFVAVEHTWHAVFLVFCASP